MAAKRSRKKVGDVVVMGGGGEVVIFGRGMDWQRNGI